MKGLKGETPEIQDTLAQSMTGGSVRLEAETVLCVVRCGLCSPTRLGQSRRDTCVRQVAALHPSNLNQGRYQRYLSRAENPLHAT